MTEQAKSYTSERGDKTWYLPSKGRGYYYRLDGPAVEDVDGTKEWWVSDKLHRLDGPAIEHKNGTKKWYVDGKELPTEEVEEWIEENNIDLKTKEGQMAFKLRWI